MQNEQGDIEHKLTHQVINCIVETTQLQCKQYKNKDKSMS